MEVDFAWLFAFLPPVIGHVLYGLPPDPNDEEDRFVRLHNGDDFSPEDEPPHPDRLERVRGVAAEGSSPLAISGHRETGVSVDTGGFAFRPAWVVVETPKTFIELPAAKFDSHLRNEGLNEVLAARAELGGPGVAGREIYSKYVKTALGDRDGSLRLLTTPVGLPIEIVPVAPGPVRVGNPLIVLVLREGVPAPDVQVRVSHREGSQTEPSDDIVGRTGDDGVFSFTVRRSGFWRVHTISMLPIDRDGADWESRWASMTFRL